MNRLYIFVVLLVFSGLPSAWANQTPALLSATPGSGSGYTQTFQLSYSDADGGSDIAWAGVLINSSISGTNSCWINYEAAARRIWLVKDNNLNWIYGTIGDNTAMQNAQCSVDLRNSSATVSGNNLTLTLALSFNLSFGGTQNIYLRASDRAGALADYSLKGTWRVGGAQAALVAAPVLSASVSPSSGTGMSQAFTFSFSDTNGFSDLNFVNIMIPSASSLGSCWIAYEVQYRQVSLASDNSSQWSYATLGAPQTLQNSQCSINAQQSSATVSGSTLQLTLQIGFSSSYTGFKSIYLRAQNMAGVVKDYSAAGTWNVFDQQAVAAVAPPIPTGTHWASASDLGTLKNTLGHDFSVVMLAPSDISGLQLVLSSAATNSMKLIVGAYPPPYTLQSNGTWQITSDGIRFLNTLAQNASVVTAVFVFNEPYWLDPATGIGNPCGAVSASQLRDLRNTIRTVWPAAKIYHDLGDPESWAPGGGGYKSCMGTKYQDQTGVADYVGVWNYPFVNGGYNRQTALDFAYRSTRFAQNSMGAQPVFLAQSFACSNSGCSQEGLTMPSAAQLKDFNCSLRTVLAPGSQLSWYVWRQYPLYSDYLANHSELWPLTKAAACTQ